MDVLWGLAGVAATLAAAFALSVDRRAINWRTIATALVLLLVFAFVVLEWSGGRSALETVTDGVNAVIESSNEGIGFLFGNLIPDPEEGVVFALQVLPVIIFFASLSAVLYHLGAMQLVIRVLGGALRRLLGIGETEATSAAANIFVGQTEGFLVIRPYIAGMSRSALFCVMTVGMSTVAGSVLVGYALLGVPLEYLLAAAFMTAPSGILMAKMVVPETARPDGGAGPDARRARPDGEARTVARDPAGGRAALVADDDADVGREPPATEEGVRPRRGDARASGAVEGDRAVNVFDAAARGAAEGLRIAATVGALLIAFISLIALLNVILGALGGLVGEDDLTFQKILGYAFAPVAFVVGVPWSEAVDAGSFLGQKLILNEFVAFADFGPQVAEGAFSDKTVAVVTFALCGFANFGSFAILLGGLATMAPSRRTEVARMGVRAVLAGSLANLLNAAVAGMFVG